MIFKSLKYVYLSIIASCLAIEALIQSPPRMIKQPLKAEQFFYETENTTLTIECEAEAEPQARYRWMKDGKELDLQIYDGRISKQLGTGTLVIVNPSDEFIGYYQCFAENELGTATSNSVFIEKAEFGSFEDRGSKTVVAVEGDPFKLSCQLPFGRPKPFVSWLLYYAEYDISSIRDVRKTFDPNGNLWFSNITQNDESDDYSYICVVSTKYKYQIGVKYTLKVKKSETPAAENRREPVLQYVTSENEVAYSGNEVNLYCIFGGTPVPQVEWRKNGILISFSTRVKKEDYGKRIHIKYVVFEDIGKYTCNVSNGVGSTKSHSINLDVLSAPYFIVQPEFKTVAISENVELRCEAHGIPLPEINWIYNGKPIAEAPPNNRRTVSSNSIVINNSTKNDTGNYGCNATNYLGYAYKDVYINVLEKIVYPQNEIITLEDRNVTLTCSKSGIQVYEWLKNGEDIKDERYSVDNRGNLKILTVKHDDAGNYTCFDSKENIDTMVRNTILYVKQRTKIVDMPGDYETIKGTQVTFYCIVTSDPSLNVQIEWLYENQPINFDNMPRFIIKDHKLIINETSVLDSGVYTCRARTELDQDVSELKLRIIDVPNTPKLLSDNCSEKSVSITWKNTGDNNSPIQGFQIEYNTDFTPSTWVVVDKSVPNTVNTYVYDLSPWVNYTFRVKAYNLVGFSEPSYHSTVCSTQPDVPYKNPDNVKGEGSKSNNLIISWTPMPEIDHNAPKLQYRVFWKRNITDEDWNIQDISDWKQNTIKIAVEPIFQPYKIKVMAKNEMGESIVSPDEVVGYSGEDVPLEAPKNFTNLDIFHNLIFLKWDPVSPQSLRGHFKGYKLQTWTDKNDEKRVTHVNPNADRYLLRVKPFSKNYVRILAFNSRYDGPPSDTLIFETPEGSPGTVQSFDAYQMGTTALFLIWKEPKEPNGILTGYQIFYNKFENDYNGSEYERLPSITDGKQTRCKVANLQPNTKYRITIKATTKEYIGESYFIIARTKSEPSSVPERPNFEVAIIPSDNPLLVNARITWLPDLNGRSGSHFYVQYKIKGESAYESTDPELNEHYIVLNGLKSGKIYEFILVAVDGDYQTPSLPQTYALESISLI